MEFIGELLINTLVRPLAHGVKAILPLGLQKKFEPDSNMGDFVGFGVLVALFAILIIGIRFYVINS